LVGKPYKNKAVRIVSHPSRCRPPFYEANLTLRIKRKILFEFGINLNRIKIPSSSVGMLTASRRSVQGSYWSNLSSILDHSSLD
jgi:hypothetical protein